MEVSHGWKFSGFWAFFLDFGISLCAATQETVLPLSQLYSNIMRITHLRWLSLFRREKEKIWEFPDVPKMSLRDMAFRNVPVSSPDMLSLVGTPFPPTVWEVCFISCSPVPVAGASHQCPRLTLKINYFVPKMERYIPGQVWQWLLAMRETLSWFYQIVLWAPPDILERKFAIGCLLSHWAFTNALNMSTWIFLLA